MNSHRQTVKSLLVFGVSHNTASLQLREKLAFSAAQCAQVIERCKSDLQLDNIALLSTCNRTEFYTFINNSSTLITSSKLINWLAQYCNIDGNVLREASFYHDGRAAVRHVFRVACGLDSLIIGETQILGQLKDAYHLAKKENTLNSELERLFQKSFAIAKQVRHSTAIGENPVSVAYAGVKLTEQFFDDYNRRTALIIGAGTTAQLTARYLRDYAVKRIIIANRTLINAQILAEEVGGFAISLEQLAVHLHESDMIFGAARSPLTLLNRGVMKKSLQLRHNELQVLIDLAVPRNFSADIAQLAAVFLFSVDDLSQIIDDNLKARQKASGKAEVMVNLFSDDFLGWLNSKPQHQLVRKMRENGNEMRLKLLEEAYRRLAHGDDPAAILEQMSYKLTNKLLHHPSQLINSIPPDHKDWLAIVADAFDVHSQSHS